MSNMKLKLNKIGLKVKKHSPEILIGVGVVGTVTSAVLACRATLKLGDILIVKLYGPAIALGAASLGCVIASHNILKKRNIAIADVLYSTFNKYIK